jgi:hypothetical protein
VPSTKKSQTRNLYIGDADVAVWEQAERVARHRRQGLSAYVTGVLRQHLPPDIQVATNPAEAAALSVAHGPILEFGRHDPHGIGWLLSYLPPGGGADAEVTFLADHGEVPIKEARAHLRRVRGEPAVDGTEDLEKITVEVGDPSLTVGFVGRWLVEPDRDATRTELAGHDAGAFWGVAVTRRRRIAVYVAHSNERWPARLTDYDHLDQAAADVPADIIARAAGELGEQRVLWRDI